ncbi:MAG: hypothetical protein E7399_07440 [Ruminococcaceae bacterium]|nr:hypothetical protein [Oscillospiraceae bacterium]
MRIKSNFNVLIGISGILFTFLNFTFGTLGYQYRPRNYTVFFGLYVASVLCVTVFSVIFKRYARKKAVVFGCLMPFIALLYEISLLFFFDFMIDYLSYELVYFLLLLGIALFFSSIIFFVYNPYLWLRILGIVATIILIVIFGFMFFISLFFSDFGSNSVIDIIDSPGHTYQAWVISSDQGAFGGDTMVNVQNTKNKINFVTGTIIGQRKRIWTGDWGNKPKLKWKDENTLLINGVAYNVETN